MFKIFIITNLICSFAIRSPIKSNIPFDYEIRAGFESKIESKYKINQKFILLYEREEGIKGFGHELCFDYTKKDIFLNKILKNDIFYNRKFESFERRVKKISIQTLDTGYIINKWYKLGYSIGWTYWENPTLLLYNVINFKGFIFELRISPKKVINTLKIWHKFSITDKTYLKQSFEFRQVNSQKYYFGKTEFGYKL